MSFFPVKGCGLEPEHQAPPLGLAVGWLQADPSAPRSLPPLGLGGKTQQ